MNIMKIFKFLEDLPQNNDMDLKKYHAHSSMTSITNRLLLSTQRVFELCHSQE